MSHTAGHRLFCFGSALMICVLGGCSARDHKLIGYVQDGEFGKARAHVAHKLERNQSSRKYMLDRMQLCMVCLADGVDGSAQSIFDEAHEVLRTQGINADKTVASVVVNVRVKFWKGEPFEQAMMFCYIAMHKAIQGEWDNARAAAGASLFLLKDFGENAAGGRRTTLEIAQQAVTEDQGKDESDSYLDHGYVAAETNFTLGYLLNGVANAALDRHEEAQDNFRAALKHNAGLEKVVERLSARSYNTVLVVDLGLGPEKIGYGPDKALAKFQPLDDWPTDAIPLSVSINGRADMDMAVACDLNTLATDHMWNNLEDVRVAKSILGTALVAGGGATMAVGDRDARMVGAALIVTGLLVKASARADTRHCEILPQRIYFVPLQITQSDSAVDLHLVGRSACRMVLLELEPPTAPQQVALHYVRMTDSNEVLCWSASDRIVYANDASRAAAEGDELPFILGGKCVRTPTHEVLSHYQQAGNLRDMTLADLENLYREEGIALGGDEVGGFARLHVLEGGDSLVSPCAGSAGYKRLFCQQHPPYQPRSQRVRELMERLRTQKLSDSVARGSGYEVETRSGS